MLALVIFFGVVITIILLLRKKRICKGKRAGNVRPPIEDVLANVKDAPYEVLDLHSPVTTGKLFGFLTWLIYTPLGESLIFKRIARQSNIDLMGGEYIPEKPTYDSFPSPPNRKTDQSNKMILETLPSPVKRERFHRNTIMDYYRAYRSKECTPVDVIKVVLQGMEESNKTTPPLKVIIEWDNNIVMSMAEASAERWGRGQPLSYLDGVPVAIKGEIMIEPYQLMGGAKFKSVVCEHVTEGHLLHKLREGGAILIGVSNLQEFGTGALGSNPNQSTPRNPYNINHYCGGSSSGSAGSVAAGFCPLAIGGDGGGSIRVPSTLCGVVGIKPTFGLLDASGMIAISHTVGVIGPIGSSSVDMAIAMDLFLTKQGTPFDLTGLGDKSLSGIKVGIYSEFFKHADSEVVSRCEEAVEILQTLGAEVKKIVIPELEEMRIAHLCAILSEMANNLARDIDVNFWEFNLETLLVMKVGSSFSSCEYINSLRQRTRGIKILESIFKEVNVIVTPGVAIPSPKINEKAFSHGISDAETSGKLIRFQFLANLTGIPGIVVPIGVSKSENLPIGLQLMAPWYEDGLLIRIAHALEMEIDGVMPRPQVYYDTLVKK